MHRMSIQFSIYSLMTSLKPPGTLSLMLWHQLSGTFSFKGADISAIPRNIEVTGPNCEQPLGIGTLDDPIQFESNTWHDQENEDYASHENPAWALREMLFLVMMPVQAHAVVCMLCPRLRRSKWNNITSTVQKICTTWQRTVSLTIVMKIFTIGTLN